MKKKPLKIEERDCYDRRFKKFLSKIVDVAKCLPREKSLYSMMDTDSFKDLETIMDKILEEHSSRRAANDNGA